jgi:integrase
VNAPDIKNTPINIGLFGDSARHAFAANCLALRFKCAHNVPMPRVTATPLSDPKIRALQPSTTPIEVRDGHARGLILRVLPRGQKLWTMRYRYRGSQKRLVLGEYPTMSLAKARDAAEDARTQVRNGGDPAGDRQTARQIPTDTVAALVKDYKAKHVRVKQRGWVEEERILDVEVLPRWKDRSVRELTRRDVRALVEPIVDRGSPIMANRVLAVVRRMLNYGVRNDWLDANPASLIDPPGREISRERVLTDDEIRRVWRLLSRQPTTAERGARGRKGSKGTDDDPICPIAPPMAAAIKMRLLTAQRGGEVIKMRWCDVDLQKGWWTIPGEFAKNGQAHRVPLVAEAIAIIKSRQQGKEKRSKTGTADSSRGDANDFVFVGSGASMRDRAKKAPSRIARALGIEFRGHDLRRTAATKMAEAGVPRHHISAVLNHIEEGSRVTRIYDRYNYDAEKRTALDTWARTLQSIVANEPGRLLPFTATVSN